MSDVSELLQTIEGASKEVLRLRSVIRTKDAELTSLRSLNAEVVAENERLKRELPMSTSSRRQRLEALARANGGGNG